MAGKAVARTPAKQSKPPATVEGKAVSKSAPRARQQSTINVTYNINGEGGSAAGEGSNLPSRGNNWIQRQFAKEPRRVPLPNGVPHWLGNSKIVGYAWITGMVFVAIDEWKNHGILPRPSRFWYSSIVYGVLALGAMIPPIVPIVNALAIGYTIMLIWQFFNGEGQFTKTVGEAEGSGGKL